MVLLVKEEGTEVTKWSLIWRGHSQKLPNLIYILEVYCKATLPSRQYMEHHTGKFGGNPSNIHKILIVQLAFYAWNYSTLRDKMSVLHWTRAHSGIHITSYVQMEQSNSQIFLHKIHKTFHAWSADRIWIYPFFFK